MTRQAENQVRVTDETWTELNAMKRPGESFDDVINRLLDEGDQEDEEGNSPATAMTAN